MFKLEPAPTFEVDVVIPQPGGEARTLSVTFKHKGRRELAQWLDALGAAKPEDEHKVVHQVLAAWDADKPLAEASVAQLLDAHHSAGRALVEAYVSALAEARTKN